MTQRFYCLIMAGVILALSACTNPESVKSFSKAKENSPAPDISVTAITDASVLKISELRGKLVLINFWATWCPPCREEIPSMMRLNKAMSGKPFQMVAISIDEGGKSAVDSFFRKSGFMLPAYLDPDGNAARSYGVTRVPESFIIDKNGIIVKKIIGGIAWDSPDVTSLLEGLMK